MVSAALAAGIVLTGVAVGAVAYFTGERGVAAGRRSGPSLSFVPKDATLVGYVDLKSVASSPLAETWANDVRGKTPFAALDEIRESTGVDVLSDVDSLTLAVGPESAKPRRWGIAVSGTFDRDLLKDKLSKTAGRAPTSAYEGTPFFLANEGTSTAIALPDGSTLLLGEPAFVREMLDASAGRKPSASENLLGWGKFNGDTFWLAGTSPDFLRGLMGQVAPNLRSFAAAGRLEGDLVLRAHGQAADPKTAQELADVLRGLIALGKLRQDESPEGEALRSLTEAISVSLLDDTIDVNLTVPYDSIRRLLSRERKNEAQE
jgi:hypothetical protein